MQDHVTVAVAAGVMEIRLNRPEKKNAITRAMYSAMAEALERAAADGAVRAIVLGGSGDSFSAGSDLKDFLDAPPAGTVPPSTRFLRAIASQPKPIVAAVAGVAVGVGTTMLLHCDLIVAGRGARFSLPFANLGLVPEAASSMLLPRLLGHQRAAEMFLLGDPIDAATALHWGLINRVVPDEDVLATAGALAATIAAKAPTAIRLTKALMKSPATDVPQRMQVEAISFGAQLKTPEFKEAITAFYDKRRPDFSRFE